MGEGLNASLTDGHLVERLFVPWTELFFAGYEKSQASSQLRKVRNCRLGIHKICLESEVKKSCHEDVMSAK